MFNRLHFVYLKNIYCKGFFGSEYCLSNNYGLIFFIYNV